MYVADRGQPANQRSAAIPAAFDRRINDMRAPIGLGKRVLDIREEHLQVGRLDILDCDRWLAVDFQVFQRSRAGAAENLCFRPIGFFVWDFNACIMN